MGARTYNLADLFEQAADQWPDREYIVACSGGRPVARRTYQEMEARANQLAHHLAAQGVGPGDHVGIYALNCVEWVETLWAVFKLRAIWININYRYVEDELAYLFENADLKALVVAPEFVERMEHVRPHLPLLSHVLVIGHEYEAALAAQSPERDFGPRSGDDRYILFTGGTTGMPKGVVWRQEDVLMTLGGGIDVRTGERVSDPTDFIAKGETGFVITGLATMPLMHGASQWSVMGQGIIGNRIVLIDHFDAAEVWRLVGDEHVNLLMITGDAMARPLWDELERAGDEYDLSSLIALSSTAALFSSSLKDSFLERFPNLVITDAVGSSESGATGISMVTKGAVMKGGPTVRAIDDAVVLDDELRPIPPGEGRVGMLARTGNLPIGYYKDPEKSAATFVTGPDGRRYVLTGDYAIHETDGSITLLGRGSVSINTGGEKVFPEEVENALKSHPAVFDSVVVGVPDERWGETVTAVVQLREGASITLEELQAHARRHIAGYKVPRRLTVVDRIVRSPAGKADYPWAKRTALAALEGETPPGSGR
jgi:acyl-CoA synthetase (AMP-forming)/AMP-acid ligase II